jgi:PEGA domain
VLSNDQRPNPPNTRCTDATLDSADPLAQFAAEDAHDSAETDRGPSFAAGDDHALVAFASETVLAAASTGSRASLYRHPLRTLWRVVAMPLAFVLWCIRGVGLFVSATTLKSVGATLLPASRNAVERLLVDLLPRLASFVTAFARLVVRTTVWAVAFVRSFRTAGPRRQQFVPLTGRTIRTGRQGRRAVVQSHPWTYPAGFFVSGVVAGAFLVTIARVPADNSVAAQVSAHPTAPPSSAHFNVVEPPPAPSPPVDRPASEQSISTSGIAANARQAAVRQQPARQLAAPQQAARRAPAAVSVRTDRVDPQSFVGSISINSRPEGAVVFLNGRRVGTTPLLMPELPVGSRAVRLTMSGYDTWSQAVQVVADRRTTVSATLVEARPTTVSAILVEASRQ